VEEAQRSSARRRRQPTVRAEEAATIQD